MPESPTSSHRSPMAAADIAGILHEQGISAAEDAMGNTDCPDGCVVEPDGYCPHGYESAGLTAGVI
jgi:hypothetical protein